MFVISQEAMTYQTDAQYGVSSNQWSMRSVQDLHTKEEIIEAAEPRQTIQTLASSWTFRYMNRVLPQAPALAGESTHEWHHWHSRAGALQSPRPE